MVQYLKVIKQIVTKLLIWACLVLPTSASAQCNWGVGTHVEPSTCAANGKINVSLTGPDAATLTDVLYSLEPVNSGGFSIPANSSSLLENIPAGQYRVVVSASCNGNPVTSEVSVTMPSSYTPFTAGVSQTRQTLNGCSTGQARMQLSAGKPP